MIKLNKLYYLIPSLCLFCSANAIEPSILADAELHPIEAGERLEYDVDAFTVENAIVGEIPEVQENAERKILSLPIYIALPEVPQENADSVNALTVASARAIPKSIKKSVVQTTHLGSFHELQTIWWYEGVVALEDGSYWLLADDEAGRQFFYAGASIAVGQSGDYYYPYWLTNQNNGVAIKAQLKKIVPNAYSRRIIAINYLAGKVWLNDGSSWEITFDDFGSLTRCLENDWVVIGINGDAYGYSFPNILINVHTNNYMRGICIY